MKERNLPEKKNVVAPLEFSNINVSMDYDSFIGKGNGMPVLFFNPNGDQNAIFNSPNAYDEVIAENSTLYQSRCKLYEMINDNSVEVDKNGTPVEAAEFHNSILSNNVIEKMLDTIEYNCTIIAAQGLYSLVKDFYSNPKVINQYNYGNDIRSLLRFDMIRSKFTRMYRIRVNRDPIGKYILFDATNGESVRPEYCFDNNVLNTMLNLKMIFLDNLAYNYGGFINFVINSNYYNVKELAKSLSPDAMKYPEAENYALEYSFVVGCLNEQAKNDISKMSDIIEIAVIDALHYFMNNCKVLDLPKSIAEIPGVKNYKKFPDGTEICDF